MRGQPEQDEIEMHTKLTKAIALCATLGRPQRGVSGILNADWLQANGWRWDGVEWVKESEEE